MERLLKIVPVFGFGWMRGDTPSAIPVPRPFRLKVLSEEFDQQTEATRAILGRVTDEEHEFASLWVHATQRTHGSPSTFNIAVFDDEPLNASAKPVVTGFGTLEPA